MSNQNGGITIRTKASSAVDRALAKFRELEAKGKPQGMEAAPSGIPATASAAPASETPVAAAPTTPSAEAPAAESPAPEAQKHFSEGQPTSSEEAPKAETKEPADKSLSSEYAILARKERALRQREAALKAREAALKPQEPVTPTQPSFDESKYIPRDRIAKDPFSVLAELGLSYDQLTEMAMNAPKQEQVQLQSELKALRDEIKAIKAESETTKKSFEESQTQSYQQAVNQIRAETKAVINNNPEFETIKETNSHEDVVQLIEETFKKDGILLPVEEAAREVENYLVEEALKLARLKKIQQKLAPKVETPNGATQKQPTGDQQSQMKTLTNSVTTTKKLSNRERAELAFYGKLNK